MFGAYIFRIVSSCWIASFISLHKISFVWHENIFSCLLLVSAGLVNLFPPFYFYFMCVFGCEVFFLQTTVCWVLLFDSVWQSVSFWGRLK
jgi:hypothetical protein